MLVYVTSCSAAQACARARPPHVDAAARIFRRAAASGEKLDRFPAAKNVSPVPNSCRRANLCFSVCFFHLGRR